MIDTDASDGSLRRWSARLVLSILTIPLALWIAVVALVPMERNSALMALGILIVPMALSALGSSEHATKKWAADRGATFPPQGIDQLRLHLLRTRAARTMGVAIAPAVDFMLMSHNNADPGGFPWFIQTWNRQRPIWALMALGYVLGSWWAEATKPRDGLGEESGTAVLTERRLGDYLDTGLQRILLAYVAIAAVSVVGWRFLPARSRHFNDVFPWVQLTSYIVVSAMALALASWTCRRREHAHDDPSLAYEELTRASTANALAGTTIAMIGAFAGQMIGAPRQGAGVSLWFQLPFGLAALLGISIWAASGTKLAFRTRRIETLRAAA